MPNPPSDEDLCANETVATNHVAAQRQSRIDQLLDRIRYPATAARSGLRKYLWVVKIAGLGACIALLLGFTLSGDRASWIMSISEAIELRPDDVATSMISERRSRVRKASVDETDFARLEVDFATRRVSVNSGFTGAEILVIGAVFEKSEDRARAYRPIDIVLTARGRAEPTTIRRKESVMGLWVNTDGAEFAYAPSYYAVGSTRPLDDIAGPEMLEQHSLGLGQLAMRPPESSKPLTQAEATEFRDALLRLKKRAGLYVERSGAITLTGKNLFRSKIQLPANVPVGPLVADVYAFRDGELLAQTTTRLEMRREGVELFLYRLAFEYSVLYGVLAAVMAVVAGLTASAIFRRFST